MRKNMGNYKIIKIDFKKNQIKYFNCERYYSIFLISYGNCKVYLDNKEYVCSTEDMIFLKPQNDIKLEAFDIMYPLQILWVKFTEELLLELSEEETNLKILFQQISLGHEVIHTRSDIGMMIKNLSKKLLELPAQKEEIGRQIFEKGILMMLIILILRSFMPEKIKEEKNGRKRFMIDEIFVFIKEHITEEITLERLEREFFVSKYHIAREFKKQTGQTVHQYIIKAKLDLCRDYIAQGMTIVKVYQLGGFGGYNHFFRAFKKEYGMTPKEYYCIISPKK